jgi:hypothetical protein
MIAALILTEAAGAAIIIVGNHDIPPDAVTPIQVVIEREPDDPDIAGMDFAIEIGDAEVGPTIGVVDLVSGTPFESNNLGGSIDQGSAPRQAFWGVVTESGTVPIPVSGVLATIQIDATGITTGTFDLRLTSVLGADTRIYDGQLNPLSLNQAQAITGSVRVVIPEPAGLGVLIGLSILFRPFVRARACGVVAGSIVPQETDLVPPCSRRFSSAFAREGAIRQDILHSRGRVLAPCTTTVSRHHGPDGCHDAYAAEIRSSASRPRPNDRRH